MKKVLFLGAVILAFSCFQSQTFGETKNVHIILTGPSLDEVSIQVVSWRTPIRKKDNIDWTLVDPRNFIVGFEINDTNKQCGDLEFPPAIVSSRSVVVHGPFESETNGWCKYNIILHTKDGDITIDPDYKVGP